MKDTLYMCRSGSLISVTISLTSLGLISSRPGDFKIFKSTITQLSSYVVTGSQNILCLNGLERYFLWSSTFQLGFSLTNSSTSFSPIVAKKPFSPLHIAGVSFTVKLLTSIFEYFVLLFLV